MLAQSARLTASSDFARATKSGVRVTTEHFVGYLYISPVTNNDSAKCGLIINKSVGGSVARHRLDRGNLLGSLSVGLSGAVGLSVGWISLALGSRWFAVPACTSSPLAMAASCFDLLFQADILCLGLGQLLLVISKGNLQFLDLFVLAGQ